MKKYLTILILVTIAGCMGCSRPVTQPVIMTRTSLETDSLTNLISRLLVQRERQSESITNNRVERYRETTVINEAGDTMRHDTHSEITTEYLESVLNENTVLKATIDSLKNVKNRVDSVPVPVPYPVEVPAPAELSKWQRWQLSSWPWMAGAALALLVWGNRRRLLNFIKKIFLKVT